MINCEHDFYEKTYQLRKRFLEIFSTIGFGHATTAFSETEILVELYYNIMQYKIDDAVWSNRDRFVISKGHGAGMLFPIYEDLNMLGGRQLEEILKIGENSSDIQKLYYPGFDFYGGSLGLGLGMAAGLALGAKMNRESWLTFCLLGDAECCEGAIWEAMMFSGKYRLNNLIAIIDRNSLGCSDFTENMIKLEPLEDKINAFGWSTKVIDGHSFEELEKVFQDIRVFRLEKPLCIIANTIKGKGLDYLSNQPLMHGYIPKEKEAEYAIQNLRSIKYEDE